MAHKIEEGLPSFEKSGLAGTNVDRGEYYAMCMSVFPTKGYEKMKQREKGYKNSDVKWTATRSTATGDGDRIAAVGDGMDDPTVVSCLQCCGMCTRFFLGICFFANPCFFSSCVGSSLST